MNSRERIIEMSIRLFNEQSTGAVSTNHIAAALEMVYGTDMSTLSIGQNQLFFDRQSGVKTKNRAC